MIKAEGTNKKTRPSTGRRVFATAESGNEANSTGSAVILG